MRTDLVIDALRMAIAHRNPPPGVIFHSDRGCQYTSEEFRIFCRANGVRPSVGRTGICFDNAVAESFFATLKKELVHTRPWPTIDKLRTAVFEYIESYYKPRNRVSTRSGTLQSLSSVCRRRVGDPVGRTCSSTYRSMLGHCSRELPSLSSGRGRRCERQVDGQRGG